MPGVEQIEPRKVQEYQQAIAELNAYNATARRLEEMYVRYVILANAAGIAACLTITGGILKEKISATIPLSHVAIPMWIYALGVVTGGVFVSLRRAQAERDADAVARRILELRKSAGDLLVDPKPTYSHIVRQGLPHLGRAATGMFLVSQLAFLVGTIWGLVEISYGG